jgi:glutathione S-transferase
MLTFAPMINSECCRFLLAHYGVGYTEERHIFGVVSLIAFMRNGNLQIPLIQGDGISFVGPEPLVGHYEPLAVPDKKLTPTNAIDRAQVEADFQCFNNDLAGETAVIGYYYLLSHKDIMVEPFTRGLTSLEIRITKIAYPLLNMLFTALLKLSPERVAQALAKTRAIFDETDKRLADGRQYLVGGRLSLADIALATAAGPLILPPSYGSPMPPFEAMPQELQAIITDLRSRPTGKFVNQLFEMQRNGG